MIKYLFLSCFVLLFAISNLYADFRSYVWTYEYQTMKKGEREIEHYLTLSSPNIEKIDGTTSAQHQIEFEMGMTDHFDFAIYQIFKQNATGGLTYDNYKLRFRYRFGEKDLYFVDPLVYLEYYGKPDFSGHKIEFKLILAKDINKFNISFNPYIELEKQNQKDMELIPCYALGIRYEISDLTRFGIEFKGNKYANYFGPTISHGNENAYFNLGTGFAIGEVTQGKAQINIRTILGINL